MLCGWGKNFLDLLPARHIFCGARRIRKRGVGAAESGGGAKERGYCSPLRDGRAVQTAIAARIGIVKYRHSAG